MNNKKLTASDIAQIIINEANKQGITDLSNLKLQKLLYFAYGWHSTFYQECLFDEHFSAWDYGPVVEKVHFDLRHNGRDNIKDSLNFLNSKFKDTNKKVPDHIQETIDFISIVYFKYTAFQLVNISRVDGGPWYKAYHNDVANIEYDIIKEYFTKLHETKAGY